jgi:RNA polymerase sigma-70 factor (ECF subfamily)
MNHLQSARVQREEYFGEWLPEPLLTDPNNDPLKALKIDESLSMAFLVLLERLTPIGIKDVFVVTNPDKLARLPRLEEG